MEYVKHVSALFLGPPVCGLSYTLCLKSEEQHRHFQGVVVRDRISAARTHLPVIGDSLSLLHGISRLGDRAGTRGSDQVSAFRKSSGVAHCTARKVASGYMPMEPDSTAEFHYGPSGRTSGAFAHAKRTATAVGVAILCGLRRVSSSISEERTAKPVGPCLSADSHVR